MKRAVLIVIVTWLIPSAVTAQIVHDGSLGHAGALNGPNFAIPASAGKTVGTNLFHSFSQFNIQAGETATFTAPSNIVNILARVTGGAPSQINGTLRTRLDTDANAPHPANFYLINPAGVIFGPGASLDVGGSFVVTTADYLRLTDGQKFTAAPGAADALLTTAAPVAFGFLAAAPAGVTVNQTTLQVPDGKVLSIVSGDVQITSGNITAPAGGVNVLSAGSTGEIVLDAATPQAVADMQQMPLRGIVSLSGGSRIDASGSPGGRVVVIARDRALDGSNILSNTSEGVVGNGIKVDLTGMLNIFSSGSIESDTLGTGNAGDIVVNANLVQITGTGLLPITGIASTAQIGSSGMAGKVDVTAIGSLKIFNAGSISADTHGPGKGGDVTVAANSIVIDGTGQTTDDGPDGDFLTGISSNTYSPGIVIGNIFLLGGEGGNVVVTAPFMTMRNSGKIAAITSGSGHGGNVHVKSDSIQIDGAGQLTEPPADSLEFVTGISTTTEEHGKGGNITVEPIHSLTLSISNKGAIAADTLGPGDAGNIFVMADSIRIIGNGFLPVTGISGTAQAGSTGNAGSVQVQASGSIKISNAGSISADTHGPGKGGDINVVANSIVIDGTGQTTDDGPDGEFLTGISSNTFAPGFLDGSTFIHGGEGGKVAVTAPTLIIRTSGKIAASTSGSGDGGNVLVKSDSIHIDGTGQLHEPQNDHAEFVTGISSTTDGTDFVNGNQINHGGRGGNVAIEPIHALAVSIISNGAITADTLGTGTAGDISVIADSLQIFGVGRLPVTGNSETITGVSATAQSESSGDGGIVKIVSSGSLNMLDGAVIEASSLGSGHAGKVDVTVSKILQVSANSTIKTSADHSFAGDVIITAKSTFLIGSQFSTASVKDDGGNINLKIADRVVVLDSFITAQAGENGASITIDPRFVILNHSTINGLSGKKDVFVKIVADNFFASESQILTNTGISFPATDISGSLILLPAGLRDSDSQFTASCLIRAERNASSLTIRGLGALAPDPAGWLPVGPIGFKSGGSSPEAREP